MGEKVLSRIEKGKASRHRKLANLLSKPTKRQARIRGSPKGESLFCVYTSHLIPFPPLHPSPPSKAPQRPFKSHLTSFSYHLCQKQRSHPLRCLGSSGKHHSKRACHPRNPPNPAYFEPLGTFPKIRAGPFHFSKVKFAQGQIPIPFYSGKGDPPGSWLASRLTRRTHEKRGCLPVRETKKPGSKITETISQK